ncbi:hypothetical protein K438DRAFT_2136906 [Mycena galopus ATCC 62051]|nr:hypothetical protein K438DRAFT_2136906 [Mycena galopus ATCC 62051]
MQQYTRQVKIVIDRAVRDVVQGSDGNSDSTATRNSELSNEYEHKKGGIDGAPTRRGGRTKELVLAFKVEAVHVCLHAVGVAQGEDLWVLHPEPPRPRPSRGVARVKDSYPSDAVCERRLDVGGKRGGDDTGLRRNPDRVSLGGAPASSRRGGVAAIVACVGSATLGGDERGALSVASGTELHASLHSDTRRRIEPESGGRRLLLGRALSADDAAEETEEDSIDEVELDDEGPNGEGAGLTAVVGYAGGDWVQGALPGCVLEGGLSVNVMGIKGGQPWAWWSWHIWCHQTVTSFHFLKDFWVLSV